MAAYYVFDECKEGRHDDCPKWKKPEPRASKDGEPVIGGALCACPHHREENPDEPVA
jgi:hypothetical protein